MHRIDIQIEQIEMIRIYRQTYSIVEYPVDPIFELRDGLSENSKILKRLTSMVQMIATYG